MLIKLLNKLNTESEITVVGAGPAGAISAGILANLGHDVLLLDKSAFPRDKTCGDLIAPLCCQNHGKYRPELTA